MRLLSLTVRNYRLHREQTVSFDPSRHLIGGPNETGKSTLAEAIHRALFFRHRSGGEVQRAMKSEIHNGHPEVTLVFEAGGRKWTLDKRFSGANGTARLMSDDGATFQGDAAEEKLAELTRNAEGIATTSNQLATRWAHLWIWQGSSGDDPSGQTAGLRDQLVQRLQEQGLAAVMQSATDERARENIRIIHDGIFTATGAVKANSRLDRAIKDFTAAEQSLGNAIGIKQRLENAVSELEAAAAEVREAEAALPGEREKLTATQAQLERVNALQQEKEKQQLVASQKTKDRETIESADLKIRDLSGHIRALEEELAPKEAALASLTAREATAREALANAEAAVRDMAETLRAARQQHDLAGAAVTLMEQQALVNELSAKAQQVRDAEQELAGLRDRLARLPAVTPEDLERLRNLESRIAQAQAAVNAIAAGIECVTADLAVDLDGQALAPGETRIITETAELKVGERTLLRIRPGGGATLADLLRELDGLRDSLTTELDRLAIRSVAEATEVVTRRQALGQEISNKESGLKAMGAASLPAALESARSRLATAMAEVARRTEAIATDRRPTAPVTLEEARAHRELTEATVRETGEQEQALATAAGTRRSEWKQRHDELEKAKASLEADRQQLDKLRIESRLLEEQHGTAEARAATLENARSAESTAQAALATTSRELDELRPDFLNTELARLRGVLNRLEQKRIEAGNRRVAAETLLAQDGTRDPEADLLQARAAHASALEARDREQRHADAIRLLHQLFSESQAAISESLTQPIADRVAGYLECLFGPGVRVRVDLSDATDPRIHLIKPGEPTFEFDSLSGGTKEQVAAAVRLAMAEIIAAAHDGCLPILFDDAFAYADPGRVQALQSMLYLAASRGLQVIVLTCTPADYTGLGAAEVRLTTQPRAYSPPAQSTAVEPTTGAVATDPGPTAEVQPPHDGAESQFLDALRAQGGSAGNQSLRGLLGWDETTYEQVKASLIARNLITPGRGRGGSVTLNPDSSPLNT